jgi:hypothetical protein
MMQCSVCFLPKARDSTQTLGRFLLSQCFLRTFPVRQGSCWLCLLQRQRILPFLGNSNLLNPKVNFRAFRITKQGTILY